MLSARTWHSIANTYSIHVKGSVISYREGGYKMGKPSVQNSLHPRPLRKWKTLYAPLLKGLALLRPYTAWLKIQGSHIETCCFLPICMAKHIPAPPPPLFFQG